MDGDFKGDFSRDSFNILQVFSRVLMQQGRVQLDADWNEQADSLLYYLRTLATNVIGPVGGRGNSFLIDYVRQDGTSQSVKDFTIHTGHYYVDGILSVNDPVDNKGQSVSFKNYTDQPYFQDLSTLKGKSGNFLIYLDVWERQVTALENDSIREVALGPGGPDTATRGEIVWQVRVISLDTVDTPDLQKSLQANPITVNDIIAIKNALTALLQSKNRGELIASSDDNPDTVPDPCIISPDAKFRGEENQLYRVEIHTGGTPVAQSPKAAAGGRRKKAQQQESTPDGPTFKWSREDGSVVFAVFESIQINPDGIITVSLDNLGRDNSRFTLAKDDWVELLTPSSSLKQAPGQMLQVSKVDYTLMQVVLTFPGGTATSDVVEWITNANNEPASGATARFLLRRWDYHGGIPAQGGLTIANDGAAKIIEYTPLHLEKGIHITFKHPSPPAGATDKPDAYRTGDYWLIPARTATGTILWPSDSNGPLSLLPKGVTHHYAPLALITLNSNGEVDTSKTIIDLRSTFNWLIEIAEAERSEKHT